MELSNELSQYIAILEDFISQKKSGKNPEIDRKEVVAHATLSGFIQHWPSLALPEIKALLEQSSEIKTVEKSRWIAQRRIAVLKLAVILN